MTKKEFAEKLYTQLRNDEDIQKIVDSIRRATKENKLMSVNEQLEIVYLIREIHCERTKGVFESVDGFLTLVNTVEAQIKSQSTSSSESGGSSNDNANK